LYWILITKKYKLKRLFLMWLS